MGFSKIKNKAFLAIVLFFSCSVILCAGQSSVDPGEKSIFSNSGPLYGDQSDSETTDDSLSGALHKMMLAVLIVIVLGVAAIYASKKILPKFAATQGKTIKVIETVHLGSRKTVHLLEVAGQQILIGSTQDRITKLADIFAEKSFPLRPADNSEATE